MTKTMPRWAIAGLLAAAYLAGAPRADAAPILTDGYQGTLVLGPTFFAEADVGTTNPVASFTGVAGYGRLSVSYGAYFAGQSYAFDSTNPAPPVQIGDAASGPLSIASDPNLSARVQDDADAPANPVVGGSILSFDGFIGPLAILFSTPVTAAELTVGDLAAVGQVTLEAFAADGSSLGSLASSGLGYETFDLQSSGGAIAGLSVRSTDNASALAADVSGVGVYGSGAPTAVPAPGASALVLAGAVLCWARYSGRRRAVPGRA